MTKLQMYRKLLDLGLDKYHPLRQRLFALANQRKIMGGCILVYESYTHRKYISMGTREDWLKMTKIGCNVRYQQVLEDFDKLEEFVLEQEAATMENCQRTQVLRKKEVDNLENGG